MSMMPSATLTRRSLLTGVACAATTVPGTPVAAGANPGRTVAFVQPWVIRDLAPGRSGHNFTQAGITETLVEVAPDGRLVPGLARGWRAGEDLSTWRFALHPDAAFHDGTPASAAAVAASLAALVPASTAFADLPVKDVVPVDGAVEIRLQRPFARLPALLADPSVAVLAPAAFDRAGAVVGLVGTGPFRVAALDPPFRLASRRWPRHRTGGSDHAALSFRSLIDPDDRVARALDGACDVAVDLPGDALATLADCPGMAVERIVTPRVHLLQLNTALPQFADPRVRRALHMAIDRGALAAVAAAGGEAAVPAPQYFSPAMPAWHDRALEADPFDPAAAARLLDDLGWRRGPDGVRTRGGVRLEGTIHAFRRRPVLAAMAARLSRQLAAVGVDVEVRVADWGAIEALRMAGGLSMALTSANPGVLVDPAPSLARDFAGPGGGAAGAPGWSCARMAALLDRYALAGEASAADAVRREIAHLLDRELPALPLVRRVRIDAVRHGLPGYRPDPFDRRYLS